MYYGGNQHNNRVSAWQSPAAPQGQAIPAAPQAADHFPCRATTAAAMISASAHHGREAGCTIGAGLSGKPWRWLHIDQQPGQLIFDKRALFLNDQHFIERPANSSRHVRSTGQGILSDKCPIPTAAGSSTPSSASASRVSGVALPTETRPRRPLPGLSFARTRHAHQKDWRSAMPPPQAGAGFAGGPHAQARDHADRHGQAGFGFGCFSTGRIAPRSRMTLASAVSQ